MTSVASPRSIPVPVAYVQQVNGQYWINDEKLRVTCKVPFTGMILSTEVNGTKFFYELAASMFATKESKFHASEPDCDNALVWWLVPMGADDGK